MKQFLDIESTQNAKRGQAKARNIKENGIVLDRTYETIVMNKNAMASLEYLMGFFFKELVLWWCRGSFR